MHASSQRWTKKGAVCPWMARRLLVSLSTWTNPARPSARMSRVAIIYSSPMTLATDWVATLELNRGRFEVGKFHSQLQAGARAAEQFVPPSMKVEFRPVAVFGAGMRKAERNVFSTSEYQSAVPREV